jgi:hypothetical protein
MCTGQIVNMKPNIFWESVLQKLLILVFVFSHVNGVLWVAAFEEENHDREKNYSSMLMEIFPGRRLIFFLKKSCTLRRPLL